MSKNYELWLADTSDAHQNRHSSQAQIVVFLAGIDRSLAVIADILEREM